MSPAARRALWLPPAAGVTPIALGAALAAGLLVAMRPSVGVGVIAAICGLPLVISSLPVGIAGWIILLFIKPLSTVNLAADSMLLLIAAGWAGTRLAKRGGAGLRVLHHHRVLWPALGLFVVWTTLSLAWADDPGVGLEDLGWWALGAGVLIVVATTIETPRQLRLVVGAFVLGGALDVVLAWLVGQPPISARTLERAPDITGRLRGIEGDPNDLAAQLVPAIALGAALSLSQGRVFARALIAAPVALMTVALIATESRGGLLAALVAGAAALIIYRPRPAYLIAVLATACVAIGGLLVAQPGGLKRVTSFGDEGAGRSTLWLVAARLAEERPLTGVGVGNYRVLAPQRVREPGALRYVGFVSEQHQLVHNVYLQLLAELGIIGLGLFLAVAAACLRAAYVAARAFDRLGRRDVAILSRGVLVATVGALAASLTLSNLRDPRLWILLALGPALYGIAAAAQASAKARASAARRR